MKKVLPVILSSIISFIVLTSVSYGDGIVNCGNYDQPKCNFDYAVQFVNNIVNLIIKWSAWIATVTITIAGARILLHPDNSGERTKAKEMFMKTVYGFFFFFCSFLIVKLIVIGLGTTDESKKVIFHFLKFK